MLKEYIIKKYKMFKNTDEYSKNPKSLEEYAKDIFITTDEGYIIKIEYAEDLLRMLNNGEISLSMDQYDKVIGLDVDQDDNPNKRVAFNSTDDIVLVHKTPVLPIKDTIITKENAGMKNTITFINPADGKEHKVPYLVGNDTTHYTLNCPVSNHEFGNNWDNMKYAIVVRFNNIDKDKILDTKSEDTYVDGDSYLGNEYFLLCPQGEKDKAQSLNPNATIIEYDSQMPINDAINSLISFLGKKVKAYGGFGWGKDSEFHSEDEDEKFLKDIIDKEQLPYLPGKMHSETEYMARRMWKREYNAYIALIEYNKEHHINMPREVMTQAVLFGGGYSLPGNVPSTVELYKKYVIPLITQHGYTIPEDLFEGIQEDTTIKIIDTTGDFPRVYCPGWENTIRTKVLDLLEKANPKKEHEDTEIEK